MGNTASNANNGHRTVVGSSSDHRPRSPKIHSRNHSNSPSPGLPHRSMRTKKRSLELPDLASLSLSPATTQRGRPAKPQPIPIPILPGAPNNFTPADRPRLLPSTPDLVHPPSTHHPFPPPPRNNPPLFRGAPTARQQPPISARQQAAQQRIQELYNQSQHVPPPVAILPPLSPTGEDPHSPGFVRETVKSSIPIALGVVEGAVVVAGDQGLLSPAMRDDPVLVPTKITWRGGGKTVVLARAGDDDWKGRTIMERESPTSLTFQTTVNLLPGTHHIRFLVDDQWRVADDLPTAVDDQGSLANYVALPLAYSTPPAAAPQPPPPTIVAPIPTSISANKGKPPIPGQSFWSAASQDDEDEENDRRRHRRTAPTPAPNVNPAINNAQWTSVLPPELIEAAKEEELYLAANSDTSRTHVHGFVPAPNIPPAPGLPRHLDKLILNARVSPAASAAGSVRSGTPGSGGVGTSVGSGQGRGGRRERREREREGDRRDRERTKREGGGNGRRGAPGLPPAPPPSEAGGEEEYVEEAVAAAAAVVPLEPVIVEEPQEQKLTTLEDAVGPDLAVSTAGVSDEGGIITPSGSGLDETSTPGSGSGSLNPSPIPSQTTTATPTPVPTPTTTKPSLPHPPSGSRAITIDTANMPGMTDDGSVLPVPSHVVLHHLSTSAIRNGVLAVGNTIRYRKKYLTTIYYKPT